MSKIEQWAEEMSFDDETMKLEYRLDEFLELYRRDENLIGGCQSKIWVTVLRDKEGKIVVDYDSDAMITKGITHIICDCFNDCSTGKKS